MKKLLALLCAIAVLCALCIPAMAAEDKVPVVASVPAEWTTPYLYAWDANGSNADWPGVPMQSVDGWWYAYMPNTMENVIISNNGAPQTGDNKIDAGLPVCVQVAGDLSCEIDYDLPVEVPEYAEVVIPTYKLHVGIPEGWEKAYVWAWDDNLTNAFSAWPGQELQLESDGFWYAEVKAQFKNIVIAEKDGGAQTIDLTVSGDENWVLLTQTNAEGKYEANVTTTAPEGYEPPKQDEPVTPPADGGEEPTGNVKVHAMVPADWTQANAWAWRSSDTKNAFEAWPGAAMTKEGDWYVIEVPAWVDYFIVNNGSAQTADLSIEAGKEVWLDATDFTNVQVHYSEPDIEAPTVPPTTAPAPTTPAPSEPAPSEPATPEPVGTDYTGLIIGIVVAAVAVVAGGVAIFFILKKKPE